MNKFFKRLSPAFIFTVASLTLLNYIDKGSKTEITNLPISNTPIKDNANSSIITSDTNNQALSPSTSNTKTSLSGNETSLPLNSNLQSNSTSALPINILTQPKAKNPKVDNKNTLQNPTLQDQTSLGKNRLEEDSPYESNEEDDNGSLNREVNIQPSAVPSQSPKAGVTPSAKTPVKVNTPTQTKKNKTTSPTSTPTPNKTVNPTPTPSKIVPPTIPSPQIIKGDPINTKYGVVQVQITIINGQLNNVNMLSAPAGRNAQFTQYATPILISQSIKNQSANIAGASGATYTSQGFINSLQSALNKVVK